MTRVKICGIARPQDAAAAAAAGADAVGMVFWEGSRRRVGLDQAAEIAACLPPLVERVGVFLDPTPAEVERVLRAVPLARVQIHGAYPAEAARELHLSLTRALVPDATCEAEVERWRAARPDVHFLLDQPKNGAPVPQAELWRQAAALARRLPLILAGGLDEDSVVVALERVRPAAVDVARGVEREPGVLDPVRLGRFLAAVRRHDARSARTP